MRFDELFEMRKLTGTNLKDYIRSNGFSKVSFCKKTEISRYRAIIAELGIRK